MSDLGLDLAGELGGDDDHQGINWPGVRLALRDYVVAGAAPDIAKNHVIWGGQQRAVPDGAYVTIDIIDEEDHGLDRVEIDEEANTLTEHVIGDRTLNVRITVFGGVTERNASRPWRIASRIRASRLLSKNSERLNAACCAVLKASPVTAPGRGINSAAFEPRAMFELALHVVSDVASSENDVVSVIETVNKSGNIQ